MDIYIIGAVLIALGIVEVLSGVYLNSKNRTDDWLINVVSLAQFTIIIKPGVVVFTSLILNYLDIGIKDALKDIPFWYALIGYMLADDFLHYWYHRKGHEWTWLWRFHKTHHTTPTMNVAVAFRQSIYWFLLMPNLYFGALAVYLGLGEAFLYATILKGIMEFVVHVGFRFDLILHKNKFLKPIGWLLERIITLPDTHHMHHGTGKYGKDQGNYSSFLFIWDVVFGTASFPHAKQEGFGTLNDPKEPWTKQLYYPTSKD